MKSTTYYLLRREWLQYKSFGKSWIYIWLLYLGMYFLLGTGADFIVIFLPVIMTYSALYSAKQTGEAVSAGTEDFLLPVPLREVLRARYLFSFLVGASVRRYWWPRYCSEGPSAPTRSSPPSMCWALP